MEAEMERAYINSNFGDVTSNPRARQYAAALVDQRLAESGRQKATLKDYEEAVNITRRKFNMPGAQSPTPSDATRRKFSGTGLGGASNGASQGRGEIRMNEDMQAMAEAAYSRIRDPNTGKYRKTTREEAHRLWAQGPGKKMLAKTGG
jgi:hypothetical protein